MSDSIKHKMLKLEATPPQGAWSHIAASMDEASANTGIAQKLLSAEVTPPVNAWQHILSSLHPDEINQPIAEKLLAAAVIPPASVWQNIKSSLETRQSEKPAKPWYFTPLFRYAAAAVFAGFLVWGGIQFVSNNGKNDAIVETTSPFNKPSIPSLTTTASTATTQPDTEAVKPVTPENELLAEKRNDAALEESKHTYARLESTAGNRFKHIASAFEFSGIAEDNAVNDNFQSNIPDALNKSNRYITVMTPDCNLIRISKKMEDLSCCISGEIVDKACEQKLEKWRKKMASSSTHPANFVDIMELVEMLEED